MRLLQSFAEEVWLADGPLAITGGFRYPTRMAVVRLANGGLFVWSPVTLTTDLRTEVDALGEVRFLVAPNALHHLFLAEWRSAYPAAQLYAPPGLRPRRRDLEFDADLSDAPPGAWLSEIDQVVVPGNLITTEVVFFHKASRTTIFTDLIQHFERGWFSGWRGVVAQLDLMTEAQAETPRKFRNTFVGRRAARAAIRRILDWPTENVVMAHGQPILGDGRAFIRRAFGWLL